MNGSYDLCGNCSLQWFIYASSSLSLKTKQFYPAKRWTWIISTNKKIKPKKKERDIPKVLWLSSNAYHDGIDYYINQELAKSFLKRQSKYLRLSKNHMVSCIWSILHYRIKTATGNTWANRQSCIPIKCYKNGWKAGFGHEP